MITQHRIKESARADHAHKLFGIRFLWIESFVFDTAGSLSPDYDGGLWDFFPLSNGGFYMAPTSGESFSVACDNGFSGTLSADALGITACLYAYSLLSFSPDEPFAESCASNYHHLRDFALQHAEVKSILAATD